MRWLWAFGVVLLAAPASAERISVSVTDVTAVSDRDGNTRILFRAGPTERMDNVAVRRAWLRWTTGASDAQRVALQVHAMSGAWSPGGASWNTSEAINPEEYSRQEIEVGASREIKLEVTHLLKEVLEQGTAAEGFVLTVGDGAGLRSDAVDALGDMSQATLEVEYRRVPPLPPAQRG